MQRTTYFVPRKSNCFGASIANLLLEFDEHDLAEEVYREYHEHRLILSNFMMYVGVATRMVSELTKGAYEGTLHINFLNITNPRTAGYTLRNLFGTSRHDEMYEIMHQESKAGRIVNNSNPDSFVDYKRPAILVVPPTTLWIPGIRRSYGIRLNRNSPDIYDHAIVEREDRTFVDNGLRIHRYYRRLFKTAVLEVKKK